MSPLPGRPITNNCPAVQNLQPHQRATNNFIFTSLSFLFLYSSSSSSSRLGCPIFTSLSFPLSNSLRRFLKIPTMSISNPNKNHRFPTPQSLSDWLRPRLPSDSLASWGVKPGTKNVHNLWLELSEGETSLADSTPPIRTVNVVTVRVIGKNNLILVESHQELSDGSVRSRFRPLSEKMKPNETPQAAVFRAVKEELGSILNDAAGALTIVPGSYKEKVEERNSVSYPGLPACYVLHSVDVVVDGLPEGEFCTEEAEEYADSEEKRAAERAVSVKRHFWKWVTPESLQSS